jgi:hypothetical protein
VADLTHVCVVDRLVRGELGADLGRAETSDQVAYLHSVQRFDEIDYYRNNTESRIA